MSSFKLFILSLLILAAMGLVIAVVVGAGGVFAAFFPLRCNFEREQDIRAQNCQRRYK